MHRTAVSASPMAQPRDRPHEPCQSTALRQPSLCKIPGTSYELSSSPPLGPSRASEMTPCAVQLVHVGPVCVLFASVTRRACVRMGRCMGRRPVLCQISMRRCDAGARVGLAHAASASSNIFYALLVIYGLFTFGIRYAPRSPISIVQNKSI